MKRIDKKMRSLIQIIISFMLLALGLILQLTIQAKNDYIWLIIYVPAYLIVGGEIVYRAIVNIFHGKVFDECFLMAIASIGAFIVGSFPEAVAVMLFYQVGELFQQYAVEKSRKSISSLMDIRPDYANIKRGDTVEKVSPYDIEIGDIIVIKAGEKVPLDAVVIDGNSTLDTSALTGESLPREVGVGCELLSGCINVNGLLTAKATKIFSESTASKILDLVENATDKKSHSENFITKFARYYTPTVVILATLLAVIPPLIFRGELFSEWIYRALTFLVISCPCALVISVPLSFFGGIGASSKQGILIKGSNYLEALSKADTVVFDKTGTLTKGVFNVQEINPVGISKEELLEIAVYAECFSNHPISQSLKEAYKKEIDESKVTSTEEIAGEGVKAVYLGKTILAGNLKLMSEKKVKDCNFDKNLVGTIVHIAINGVYAGNIVIADEIKEDSKKAIELLKANGIKQTTMLTGDSKSIAEKVAKRLEIDTVFAELLPTNKVEKIEELLAKKNANSNLVFVGDGINDAPVLARADIGVAMGGLGADSAIEAADIVIMTDEPSKLSTGIKIAKRTRIIVKENIIFSLAVKACVLLLGALGIVTMWWAVFADVGVSVLAILNSIRVLKGKY